MGSEEGDESGQKHQDVVGATESTSRFELATNPLIDSFVKFLADIPDDFDERIERIISTEVDRNRAISIGHARSILTESYVREILGLFKTANTDVVPSPIPHGAAAGEYKFERREDGSLEVFKTVEGSGQIGRGEPFTQLDADFKAVIPTVVEVKAYNGFPSALAPSFIDQKLAPISSYFPTADKFGYIVAGVREALVDHRGPELDNFHRMGGITVSLPMSLQDLDRYAGKMVTKN